MSLAETAQLLVNLVVKADETQLAKMNTTLGQTGVSALGLGKTVLALGGAAGFGALTAGALQAEAAQGKFMAATGQSRDAAKQFVTQMDGLAGTAGTVGLSFDQIAAAGTAVAQQFQVTGAEEQTLTGHFLDFAKVTGGDATTAVTGFKEALDAFHLPASAATGLMDQLVKSSQTYGTSAGPDSVAALDKMAPALQAMGMGLDQGVGLLNLFKSAGLDSSKAAMALQHAVKGLQPGQNLNDLIAQIGAIQDPTLRAQEAMKIFGTRAGAGLANAIQPGMTSLDKFQISVQDAAGASDKAANDMMTTGDKIHAVLDKLGAGAREMGQSFGPLVTGIASLSSLAAPLAGKFTDLLKGLAAKILPQATATGLVTGGAIAEGEAEGAAGQGAIAKIGARIAAMSIPLAAEGTTVGTAVGGAMSLGMVGGMLGAGAFALFLPQILDHLTGQDATSKFANIGKFWADSTLSGMSDEAKAGAGQAFQAAWDAARASGASNDAAALAGKAAADAYIAGLTPTVTAGASDAGAAAATTFATTFAGTATRDKGWEVTAQSIAAQQATAYQDEVNRNKNSLSLWAIVRNQQIADAAKAKQLYEQSALAITGDLAGTLQKGAKGEIKSAMDALTYAITHPLELAKQVAQIQAALTSKELQAGLASKNPEILAQAQQTQARLTALWQNLDPAAAAAAANASSAFANNLNNNYAQAVADARNVANSVNAWLSSIQNNIRVNININDPTGQGPIAHGHRAEGGPVQKGVAYWVGEKRPELFVPKDDGTIIANPSMSEPRQVGMGYQPPPVYVNVQISAREAQSTNGHYSVIQGRVAGAF